MSLNQVQNQEYKDYKNNKDYNLNDELIQELIKMFKPYSFEYNEKLASVKLGNATAYQLAITMACDILIKLVDVQEKKSLFSTFIINNFWSYNINNTNISIIEIIYKFLEIARSYPNVDFKNSTYDSKTFKTKKEKFDPNYDITYSQFEKKLEDAKFVEMFKTFRSIVGRFFRKCTGSYSIPNIEDSSKWKYTIRQYNGVFKETTSKDFVNYIIETTEIYIELEKFSPDLYDVYNIFINASEYAKENNSIDNINYKKKFITTSPNKKTNVTKYNTPINTSVTKKPVNNFNIYNTFSVFNTITQSSESESESKSESESESKSDSESKSKSESEINNKNKIYVTVSIKKN
jgi:hypothetical protein